jgi:AcrR family transcriptional regulator
VTDESCEAIMAAARSALCSHGYADLTMQAIADETELSKAALHYHFDSKHDLLVAVLDHLYEDFTDRVGDPPGETPAERLTAFIEGVLTPPEPDASEGFGTALLELAAQAPYDDAIRERLERFDAFVYERCRAYVAAGVADGTFRDVDPDTTARFLVTTIHGARMDHVAIGQSLADTRALLEQHIEEQLLAADRMEVE